MENILSNGLYTDEATCSASHLNLNRFETNTKQIKEYLMKLIIIMLFTLLNIITQLPT